MAQVVVISCQGFSALTSLSEIVLWLGNWLLQPPSGAVCASGDWQEGDSCTAPVVAGSWAKQEPL